MKKLYLGETIDVIEPSSTRWCNFCKEHNKLMANTTYKVSYLTREIDYKFRGWDAHKELIKNIPKTEEKVIDIDICKDCAGQIFKQLTK